MTHEYDPVIITDYDQFVSEAKKDPYSSMWKFGVDPREVLNFKVVEKDADMSWSERYIGSTLGSCVDYGRHWDMSDKELIGKVADKWSGAMTPQFLGFMDDEKKKVAKTVLIVRKESGYLKTVTFEE